MFTELGLLVKKKPAPVVEVQPGAPLAMPEREWEPKEMRDIWWEQFKSFVTNACDYDVPSLLELHKRRKTVISAARDLADDMLFEFEDRWRE